MARTFRHTTGRVIHVSDGTRTARLVEADKNWTEDKPKRTAKAKEADSGSGDSGGRGSRSRKDTDADGGAEASESAG